MVDLIEKRLSIKRKARLKTYVLTLLELACGIYRLVYRMMIIGTYKRLAQYG